MELCVKQCSVAVHAHQPTSHVHEQTTWPAVQLARRSSRSSPHSNWPSAGSSTWWRGSSRHARHTQHRRRRSRSAGSRRAPRRGCSVAVLASHRGGAVGTAPGRQMATMSGVWYSPC